MLLGLSLSLAEGVAYAADAAATGSWVGPFTVIAAGIGMALAAGLCGLGQARAIAAALEGMARQPGAAARPFPSVQHAAFRRSPASHP
jgi:F-type H+-transporting ATPase subunit c